MKEDEGNIIILLVKDAIKIGEYVIIKNCPCKILDFSISKTGKHGKAKYHIIGRDVLTQKKIECILSSMDKISIPIITNSKYILSDISSDRYLSLLSSSNVIKEDLKLPDDENLSQLIIDLFKNKSYNEEVIITTLTAFNEEVVIFVTKNISK